MRDISIVIVSYNTKDILCKCLDTMKMYLERYPHEVIVVDNDSEDGTGERIKNSYREVTLVQMQENVGFAKAVNIGMRRASGKVIGLINSDIIFIEDVFGKILDAFRSDGKIGIIGCKLLNQDETTQKSAYWSYPGLVEELIEYSGFSEMLQPASMSLKYSLSCEEHGRDQEVAHLKGACLFLKEELKEKVGYFDERFFMYREETDYCKRTHDAGYKILFLSSARVIHLHKISSNKLEDRGITYRLDSHYQYLVKHRGHCEAVILYLIIFFTSAIRFLFAKLRGGDGRYYADIVKWHLGLRKA